MPTYAILGATGNCGRSLVQVLAQQEKTTIHALVRSKTKLYNFFPALKDNPKLKVFKGDITNLETIKNCIQDTTAVFQTVAAATNEPGCSIAQDTAKAVLAALERLRLERPASALPLVVVLSSSSTSEYLTRQSPWLLHFLIWRAAYYVYIDLIEAEKIFRAAKGVRGVFMKPGGMVHDTPHGHELSTEREETFTAWLDLAAGMVEVAGAEDGRWVGREVSVVPKRPGTRIEWRVPQILVSGLLIYYFPWTYPYVGRFQQ
ncbi:hypothetical protein LTR62_006788 [Meristemomyces frigidus]|uniref:NAD(P)-binding domain-containing protein n=1 Tax=Meristemomyces frigidus TaxID=1508187 RepID=A0AAN7TDP6_9PEZI|nr:hypothetical protein LTR62_006788 [Meristemomyces frigidus]